MARYFIFNDAAEVAEPVELDNGFHLIEVDISGALVSAPDDYDQDELVSAWAEDAITTVPVRALWADKPRADLTSEEALAQAKLIMTAVAKGQSDLAIAGILQDLARRA